MAQLSPSLNLIRQDAGLFRELDVLERLRDSLPDGYEIFHSVDWHSVHGGMDQHGEIDLVVLGPNGNILLIEVKAGNVILRDGGVFKLYRNHESDVGRQTRVQFGAMVSRLKAAQLHAYVTNCLVLPDYRIGNAEVVAIPRERIIDATEFDSLGTRVRELMSHGHTQSGVESVRRFLSNEFSVSVDLRAMGDQLQKASRRLADGLATWVPRISSPSGIIRIQATAGSGKTQLALRLLNDAAASQQRALYVCFNRLLADHIGHIAPGRARIASFHELCVDHFSQTQGAPDFNAADIFETLSKTYCEAADGLPEKYDLIIIDEGQDFDPAWVASLLPQLRQTGRLYLFEDESQRLYERDAFDLADAVSLVCNDNFRSPRALCSVINALRLVDQPVDARSPYEGEIPGFWVFKGEQDLKQKTVEAVRSLLSRGIPLSEIVVLSGKGRLKSILLDADCLEDWPTRRFSGKHTRNGDPEWTEGDLLVESVYRFKGQSASGVVLTELDFDMLDDKVRRKLFVGLTRAHLAVEMVLSEAANACLVKELNL